MHLKLSLIEELSLRALVDPFSAVVAEDANPFVYPHDLPQQISKNQDNDNEIESVTTYTTENKLVREGFGHLPHCVKHGQIGTIAIDKTAVDADAISSVLADEQQQQPHKKLEEPRHYYQTQQQAESFSALESQKQLKLMQHDRQEDMQEIDRLVEWTNSILDRHTPSVVESTSVDDAINQLLRLDAEMILAQDPSSNDNTLSDSNGSDLVDLLDTFFSDNSTSPNVSEGRDGSPASPMHLPIVQAPLVLHDLTPNIGSE